jgi:inhibitor of KinA
MTAAYTIFSLGDAAITIELGNCIDIRLNQRVLALQDWLLTNPFPGFKDSIAAYGSLTIIYDPICIKKKLAPDTTVFEWVKRQLEQAWEQQVHVPVRQESPVTRIPVCYGEGYAMDLDDMARKKKMQKEEIVVLHTSVVYRVYMIGFLPGFAYLASINEKLIMSRKEKPLMVPPGSVGIAGEQTGIYPFLSPGGWHIIGRTPVPLFNAGAEPPVLLQAGDAVQFYAISKEEFMGLNSVYKG